MGVTGRDLDLLIRLKKAKYIPAGGAVIDIGAQHLDSSFLASRSAIAKMEELFGVAGGSPLPGPLSTDAIDDGAAEHRPEALPCARMFWQRLGLEYASIDATGVPAASSWDLNAGEMREAALGHYHLATNFGTTAHIVNQLQAFKVIHNLVAPGGVMIHRLPAQGAIEDCLFTYSPKFFWRLAWGNDYRWLYLDYRQDGPRHHGLPQGLVDAIAPYESDVATRGLDYQVVDASLVIVLQKRIDRPFVQPLDLPDSDRLDRTVVHRYGGVVASG